MEYTRLEVDKQAKAQKPEALWLCTLHLLSFRLAVCSESFQRVVGIVPGLWAGLSAHAGCFQLSGHFGIESLLSRVRRLALKQEKQAYFLRGTAPADVWGLKAETVCFPVGVSSAGL